MTTRQASITELCSMARPLYNTGQVSVYGEPGQGEAPGYVVCCTRLSSLSPSS
jgi:hypothetical protein